MMQFRIDRVSYFLEEQLAGFIDNKSFNHLLDNIFLYAHEKNNIAAIGGSLAQIKYTRLTNGDLSNIGWLLGKLFGGRERSFSARFIQIGFCLDQDSYETMRIKLKNKDARHIRISEIESFLKELEESALY